MPFALNFARKDNNPIMNELSKMASVDLLTARRQHHHIVEVGYREALTVIKGKLGKLHVQGAVFRRPQVFTIEFVL